MDTKQQILLIGTGAVGSYYGARLAQAGAEVSAVCRSDYDHVRSHGISIKSIFGDFIFNPCEVLNDASHYRNEPDYIIVATKVLPEIDIRKITSGKVFPKTSIVLLQNGIEIENPVAAAFPENEIISALAFICVERTAPGHILHTDYGSVTIGRYPSGTSQKVEVLSDLFNKSGVECIIEKDIRASRWKKLMWNASFNPISVLGGGLTTREMTGSAATVKLLADVMEEIIEIAEMSGYTLPRDLVEKNIQNAKTSAVFKTSMLQDHERKSPMEVEAILGNVVRIAARHGAAMPRAETMYALLKLIDEKIRNERQSPARS